MATGLHRSQPGIAVLIDRQRLRTTLSCCSASRAVLVQSHGDAFAAPLLMLRATTIVTAIGVFFMEPNAATGLAEIS